MQATQMKQSISEQQVQEYHDKGFLLLRGVLTEAEVAACRKECYRIMSLDLVEPDNIRTPFRKNSGDVPERVDPVLDLSPLYAELVRDERILAPVRALFQDEPLLFKDKLLFKLAGTQGYNMHQDQAWWQLCPADDILSVSILFDGANADNGGIEVFEGYHRSMLTPEGELRNLRPEEAAQVDPKRGYLPETLPGDILIFHSLTPHQSATNTSSRSRRSLYLSYNAARSGDLNAQYYEHYKARGDNTAPDKFFR